jgi:hypothetical protein
LFVGFVFSDPNTEGEMARGPNPYKEEEQEE